MQEPDENKIILNFLLSGSCILDMAHHILCEGSAVLPVTEETNMAKKHDIIVPIILARIQRIRQGLLPQVSCGVGGYPPGRPRSSHHKILINRWGLRPPAEETET